MKILKLFLDKIFYMSKFKIATNKKVCNVLFFKKGQEHIDKYAMAVALAAVHVK